MTTEQSKSSIPECFFFLFKQSCKDSFKNYPQTILYKLFMQCCCLFHMRRGHLKVQYKSKINGTFNSEGNREESSQKQFGTKCINIIS